MVLGWPPEEPDRMGPESRSSDDNTFPMPADWPEPSSDEPWPEPPLAPPKKPLRWPNLLVMACTLGVITAEIRLWKLLIGFGTSIPYCLFLAILVWSSWSTNRVFASIRLSIFCGGGGDFQIVLANIINNIVVSSELRMGWVVNSFVL